MWAIPFNESFNMPDKKVATGNPALEKADREYRQQLEWQRRLETYWRNRGSLYPPFAVEHMSHERERLAAPGMTKEDRILRHQWLEDQHLASYEPVQVADVKPKNVFRRALKGFWDVIVLPLGPVIGRNRAKNYRYFLPKLAASVGAIYAMYYVLKYNANTWERKRGWRVMVTKPTRFPDEEPVNRDPASFGAWGFTGRGQLFADPAAHSSATYYTDRYHPGDAVEPIKPDPKMYPGYSNFVSNFQESISKLGKYQ